MTKVYCGSHKSRKYDLLSIREANKRIYFLTIPSVFTLECYESILRVECGMLSCFRTSLFPSNTLCISLNNLYCIILYTRNNIHVLNLLTQLWNNIVYCTSEHLLLFSALLRLLQKIISTDKYYPIILINSHIMCTQKLTSICYTNDFRVFIYGCNIVSCMLWETTTIWKRLY